MTLEYKRKQEKLRERFPNSKITRKVSRSKTKVTKRDNKKIEVIVIKDESSDKERNMNRR